MAVVNVGVGSEARLEIEQGALVDVPVWVSHKRAKNWATVVEYLDPKQPGGINRGEWWERSSGAFKYIVPDYLVVGTPVEFGAKVEGKFTDEDHWYGVVTAIKANELVIRRTKDAREAVALSAEMQGFETNEPLDALEEALTAIQAAEDAMAAGDKNEALSQLDVARNCVQDRRMNRR